MADFQYAVTYSGHLQTQMIHILSGDLIRTDAPKDNNGNGSAFSPTDLVSAALASCMLTVVGIHFDKLGRALSEIRCTVKKSMAADPRRIAAIEIEFDFLKNEFTEDESRKVTELAHNCPVAKSLSPEILVSTNLPGMHR